MIDGVSSSPFSARTLPPVTEPEVSHRDRAIAYSRSMYARPRSEVEDSIAEWVKKVYEDPEKDAKDAARAQRRAERERNGERGGNNNGNNGRPQRNNNGNGSKNNRQRNGNENSSEYRQDLRNLLKQMTNETDAKKEPARGAVKEVRKNGADPSSKRTENPPKHTNNNGAKGNGNKTPQQNGKPQFVKKDDGKGITDEGKSELKNLLSSLTKNVPKKKEVQKKPPAPKTPPQQAVKEVPQKEQQSKVVEQQANNMQHVSQQKELSVEKMKEMLHVQKPNL